MNVLEFRASIKANSKILINDKENLVREVIKFRLDDGSFYIKCFLDGDYVFADDLNENIFILVTEIKTLFQEPFPNKLNFDGKKFKFTENHLLLVRTADNSSKWVRVGDLTGEEEIISV